MLTELMQAVIEKAPKTARALQRKSPQALEIAAKASLKRARETMAPNGLPDEPNAARSMQETIFSEALSEMTADEPETSSSSPAA